MKNSRQLALSTAASVIGGAALASFLLRAYMKPILTLRAANLIKSMLVDANIVFGRDIAVHDDSIFLDWASRGMPGIGESYMASKSDAIIPLDVVLTRLLTLPSDKKRKLFKSWNAKFVHIATRMFNFQSQSRAGMVGAYHYDLGNDFFKLWLDQHHMQYSCGYFKGIINHFDLEAAQDNKLRMIAEKLKLEPGMKVLDIDCGWGGLACYLAKNHGVHVTGITISMEQLKGAQEGAALEGVSYLTSFEYRDYREMKPHEVFDRVVSIAMIEAVGYKNLTEYISVIARCLKNEGGIAIVHSTAANRSLKVPIELWILRYIFPNGFIPSIAQTLEFAERKLAVEDVHNFGPDYEKTLLCWHARFQQHVKRGGIQRPREFVRMWEFYLLYCAAGFRTRVTQLSQVVFTKKRAERYDTVR